MMGRYSIMRGHFNESLIFLDIDSFLETVSLLLWLSSNIMRVSIS